ncbi:hypothetical protein Droror1_Dr00018411 [Drosera rotundifolia]
MAETHLGSVKAALYEGESNSVTVHPAKAIIWLHWQKIEVQQRCQIHIHFARIQFPVQIRTKLDADLAEAKSLYAQISIDFTLSSASSSSSPSISTAEHRASVEEVPGLQRNHRLHSAFRILVVELRTLL